MSFRTGTRGALFGLALSGSALAQTAPPAAPPAEAPGPAPGAAPAQNPPAEAPAPAPAPPAEAAPPPSTPPAAPYTPPAAPYTPPAYYAPPEAAPAPSAPPPPPRKPDDEGFDLPTLSIRLDPVDWLLDGRLGIELEAEILKFLSVELVPVFVVNDSPPALNFEFDETELTQHSNGLGALAGTSIGVGFWLSGKPLEGTVLRAIFTNYGFTYRTRDDAGEIDELSHTERHLYGFIGSNSTWGVFTLASGFGLGVELNKQRRCFVDLQPTSDCSRDDMRIRLARPEDPPGPEPLQETSIGDLNSWTHPVQILVRLSLGVTF